jgi:hypothetical protein
MLYMSSIYVKLLFSHTCEILHRADLVQILEITSPPPSQQLMVLLLSRVLSTETKCYREKPKPRDTRRPQMVGRRSTLLYPSPHNSQKEETVKTVIRELVMMAR